MVAPLEGCVKLVLPVMNIMAAAIKPLYPGAGGSNTEISTQEVTPQIAQYSVLSKPHALRPKPIGAHKLAPHMSGAGFGLEGVATHTFWVWLGRLAVATTANNLATSTQKHKSYNSHINDDVYNTVQRS